MAAFDGFPEQQLREISNRYGTPTYVYSESLLEQAAREALAFPSEYGLTVRYAMKALPTQKILQFFHTQGLHIDASSYFEILRAEKAGIPPQNIQLTAQQLPPMQDLSDFVERGGRVTACSLGQLQRLGEIMESRNLSMGIRINPGLGSGHSRKTSVGGSSSSFGIWHEYLLDAQRIIIDYGLKVTTLHTHIGSGTDPLVWEEAAAISLDLAKQFPDIHTLNLGGGFKVARTPDEKTVNLQECGKRIREKLVHFNDQTNRRLHLEIEPGTYLVANAGMLVTQVIDVKSTDQYRFLVIDSGMTEITRPILYGAQHPITILPRQSRESRPELVEYVVVGHCCESGDTVTVAPDNAEELRPRLLPETNVGDFLVIGGVGAYCSGMSLKNYNSFPEAAEVLVRKDGAIELIRSRQTLDQIIMNEEYNERR